MIQPAGRRLAQEPAGVLGYVLRLLAADELRVFPVRYGVLADAVGGQRHRVPRRLVLGDAFTGVSAHQERAGRDVDRLRLERLARDHRPGVGAGGLPDPPLFRQVNRTGIHQSGRSRTVPRATAIARSASPSRRSSRKRTGMNAAAVFMVKLPCMAITAGMPASARRGPRPASAPLILRGGLGLSGAGALARDEHSQPGAVVQLLDAGRELTAGNPLAGAVFLLQEQPWLAVGQHAVGDQVEDVAAIAEACDDLLEGDLSPHRQLGCRDFAQARRAQPPTPGRCSPAPV